MRSRLWIWVFACLVSFIAAFWLRRLEVPGKRTIPSVSSEFTAANGLSLAVSFAKPGETPAAREAESVIEEKAKLHSTRSKLTTFRLQNTTESVGHLVRNPRAILLENALLDTTCNLAMSLPEQLHAPGDAGAYIVQSRSILDNAFRQALTQAGATIISYIPNNAYLVRASTAIIQELQTNPQVVAALPYGPYFKLKPALL